MLTAPCDASSLFLRVCYRYYFVASVVKVNGGLEFAAGMASGGLRSQRDNGSKRARNNMPSISRDGTVARCFHPECRQATGGPHFHQGGIRHRTYCNGNEQPWEAHTARFGVTYAGKVHECTCREMPHRCPCFLQPVSHFISRGGWGAENYADSDGRTIWDRFESSKGKVIVEPTGSQTKFEEGRDEYVGTIRETGKCIPLAVVRGKMSEGIRFNDAQ